MPEVSIASQPALTQYLVAGIWIRDDEMRKVLGLAIGLIALSGCATEIMQGYVGRSIQEPILDYGPPVNVVEMGQGRRHFSGKLQTRA